MISTSVNATKEPILFRPRALTLSEGFVVNTGARLYTISCIYPMQILKIMMQSQSTEVGQLKRFNYKWLDPRFFYKGVGVYSLNAPITGLTGAVDDTLREFFRRLQKRELTSQEKLGITIAAASLGIPPRTCLDLIVLRYTWAKQAENGHNAGKGMTLTKIFWETWEKNGFKGLLRGAVATYLREVPFLTTIFFLGPEVEKKLNEKLPPSIQGSVRGNVAQLGAGIGGGSITALATMGADVIKTAMQKTDPDKNPEYQTLVSSARTIWKIGGDKAVARLQDVHDRSFGIFRGFIKTLPERRVRQIGGVQHFMVGTIWRMIIVSVATLTMMQGRTKLSGAIRNADAYRS